MWKKTLWRRVDLKEKQNKPFFARNREISKIIIEAVERGVLIPYNSDSVNDSNVMSREEFVENIEEELQSRQILLKDAKKAEANSVQILDFTKEVKNMKDTNKIKIVETLWRIIYSNDDADIYETNLMRRLEGLLYIDSNIMGAIKDKIKKENK